jgi:xylulokinase
MMDEEFVLGIDLSTHGVKVLAVDRNGVIVGQAEESYERIVRPGGIQEQSVESMWESLCAAIRRILVTVNSSKICAIAVTHQRGTVISLDENNEPLNPAICDSDTRSQKQARWLSDHIGNQRLYELTGCPALAFNGLTKILWWYQEQPEIAYKVFHWASAQDWILYKLTGELKSNPGSALRMGVLDIRYPNRYAEELLAEIQISASVFPEIKKFGLPIGYTNLSASAETGLGEGIPVFPAPGDQPAAFLGTGAIKDGSVVLSLGTSFLFSFPFAQFVPFDPLVQYTLEVLPDDRYALEFGSGAGTNVLDWLRVNLLGVSSVEQLTQLGTLSQRGANGIIVIPQWWSVLNDRITGAITGLCPSHTRSDVVRATYEGLAFELRWTWEQLIKSTGFTPTRIALCGGASKNELLCQIISNVLRCPVYWPETVEASAFGAAIVAALGASWYGNIQEATKMACRERAHYDPDIDDIEFYQDLYSEYIRKRVSLELQQ